MIILCENHKFYSAAVIFAAAPMRGRKRLRE